MTPLPSHQTNPADEAVVSAAHKQRMKPPHCPPIATSSPAPKSAQREDPKFPLKQGKGSPQSESWTAEATSPQMGCREGSAVKAEASCPDPGTSGIQQRAQAREQVTAESNSGQQPLPFVETHVCSYRVTAVSPPALSLESPSHILWAASGWSVQAVQARAGE